MPKYLPFKDEILQSVDFLTLEGRQDELEDKFLLFNRRFSIVPEENISDLIEELSELTNPDLHKLNRFNIMKMWDNISNCDSNFRYACEIAKAAQSLPTSSAIVEQKFSQMKLIRNDLRNRLLEGSLEAILLIEQEYNDGKEFNVTKQMIKRFSKVRENLNERKNRKKVVKNYICSDIAKESREEEFKIEEDSQEIQQNKKELANKRKYEKVLRLWYQ